MTNIIHLSGKPATPTQTALGAAIDRQGVYHPPVLPWEGHPEDVLFDSDGMGHYWAWYSSPWVIVAVLGMSAGIIAAMIA